MWSALGTLIGGALMGAGSLGSSAIGAASSDRAAKLAYQSQQETNQLNYQMAMENRAWLTKMANTAHQREVDDLRAAGLNPILSATGGSGAAVPSMAAPVATSPGSPVADKSAIYQGMISSLLNSFSTAADITDKLGKFEVGMSQKELNEKITKTEVGKRNLISWLDNNIRGNTSNSAQAAEQIIGIVKDLSRAAANNFSVFKQSLFNDFRSKSETNTVNRYDVPSSSVRSTPDWLR